MLKLKLQYFGHLMHLTHWKRPWCWERLRAGGEGDNRGWDGWMASPTRWTWVWVDSRSWWWTGRPGMLQFMGLPRVGDDWATELNWTFALPGISFPFHVQILVSMSNPFSDLIRNHTLKSLSICLSFFSPFLPILTLSPSLLYSLLYYWCTDVHECITEINEWMMNKLVGFIPTSFSYFLM